jgi:hypothetical protein
MRRILLFPIMLALALGGCAHLPSVSNPVASGGSLDWSNIDLDRLVKRAADIATKACLIRPALDSIGPIVANIVSSALGAGGTGLTVEQAAAAGAKQFCDFVGSVSGPAVGQRRAAAGVPVSYGTLDVGGKRVTIVGTPQ